MSDREGPVELIAWAFIILFACYVAIRLALA
jgi:hypothetical protein